MTDQTGGASERTGKQTPLATIIVCFEQKMLSFKSGKR